MPHEGAGWCPEGRHPARRGNRRPGVHYVPCCAASAPGVPVRRPTTTCLPRRARRGRGPVPTYGARSGETPLLLRDAPGPAGVRGSFVDPERDVGNPSPMCTGSAAQGDRRRPPGGSTTTPGRRSRSGCGRIPAPHRTHTGHGSHDPRRGTPPEATCIGVTGRVARRRPCRGAPVELVTPSATSATPARPPRPPVSPAAVPPGAPWGRVTPSIST